MNKYEIKYMLETMTSAVDRLTDSLGKQSLHIENLWNEIGEKQNLIANQRYEIKRLKERLLEIFRKQKKDQLDEADFEKRFKDENIMFEVIEKNFGIESNQFKLSAF